MYSKKQQNVVYKKQTNKSAIKATRLSDADIYELFLYYAYLQTFVCFVESCQWGETGRRKEDAFVNNIVLLLLILLVS